jgi:hypothetical protein
MVCFVVIQERCWIILIWRRPNDQTYHRGRRLADQCTVFERWILVGKPLEIRPVNGRLWRWFDVECQRWPVVILLIGSTLARLIGLTLARRYNVLVPIEQLKGSRRWFLCEFLIGSYVKLSSAVGTIMFEGPNRRTYFWKITIQWLFHQNFVLTFCLSGRRWRD